MPRQYEIFQDKNCYNMWCVSEENNDKMPKPWSFWYFDLKEDAEKFLELIRKAN